MNTIIVAYDRLNTIGINGGLPWSGKLPVDMNHFREETAGKTVIMGRLTYDSLPERFRPLPGRQNIVMSLSGIALGETLVASSLDEAYSLAEHEPYIIGGGKIYNLALPTADRVIATEIDTEITGGDTFFPTLEEDEWKELSRIDFKKDKVNCFSGAIVTYMRR